MHSRVKSGPPERRDVSGELEPTISLSPAVTLDAYGVTTVLQRLSEISDIAARILAQRVSKEWRYKGTRTYITLRLTANELHLLRAVGGTTKPELVLYQWLAIYRHLDTGTEVHLRSTDRPPKKRSFKLPNKGRKRFRRVKLFRIHPTKESTTVTKKAAAKKKTNKKKKAAPETDEDDLESLEELEEIEESEPDDDDEEDDDEEEAPPKKRKRKSTKKSSKKKAKEEEEDDDEEDDDEDEDEAPPKRKKSSKKGKKDKSKKKGKGNSNLGRTTKELTGGVGTQELAAAASELAEVEITGRDVRVYLRKNEIPKDEEHGRYTWPSENNKGFKKLAKDIASEYEDE